MSRLSDAAEFFYRHASYSWWRNRGETEEQGRRRTAVEYAEAEQWADGLGYDVVWDIDPDIDSSDWSDERPVWRQWVAYLQDDSGNVLDSLGGVDFGRDGTPWGDPYARIIAAELAMGAMLEARVFTS